MKRNYSLTAFRAFSSAARHCNFTHAARELMLTQSAVSQRVKLLEEQIGVALFRRTGRRIQLTEEGRLLADAARAAFRQIDDAIEAILEQEAKGEVAVSALPSFAMKWLIPRLGDFYRRHPQIELRIRADNRPVNVEGENIDLAVVLDPTRSPKVRTELMMRERVFAVCSPSYLQRAKKSRRPLNDLADLKNHPLLHDDTERAEQRGLDWHSFLKKMRIEGVDAGAGASFTQGDLILQAAIAGQGIALTRTSLAARDIANGLLINPFGMEAPSKTAYYICSLEADADKPKIRALRDWLLAQAKKDFAPSPPESDDDME